MANVKFSHPSSSDENDDNYDLWSKFNSAESRTNGEASTNVVPCEGQADLLSESDSEESGFNSEAAADIVTYEGQELECVACNDLFEDLSLIPVTCGHYWCRECAEERLRLATREESSYPPRCCDESQISAVVAEAYLGREFIKDYEAKILEWKAKSRTYCSWRPCGVFAPYSRNHPPGVAICPKCEFWTCTRCKEPILDHNDETCNEDPHLAALEETAEKEHWQRCYKCGQLVERESGCNRISCRCGASFCYRCGAEWGTCKHPHFDWEDMEFGEFFGLMRPPPTQPTRQPVNVQQAVNQAGLERPDRFRQRLADRRISCPAAAPPGRPPVETPRAVNQTSRWQMSNRFRRISADRATLPNTNSPSPVTNDVSNLVEQRSFTPAPPAAHSVHASEAPRWIPPNESANQKTRTPKGHSRNEINRPRNPFIGLTRVSQSLEEARGGLDTLGNHTAPDNLRRSRSIPRSTPANEHNLPVGQRLREARRDREIWENNLTANNQPQLQVIPHDIPVNEQILSSNGETVPTSGQTLPTSEQTLPVVERSDSEDDGLENVPVRLTQISHALPDTQRNLNIVENDMASNQPLQVGFNQVEITILAFAIFVLAFCIPEVGLFFVVALSLVALCLRKNDILGDEEVAAAELRLHWVI